MQQKTVYCFVYNFPSCFPISEQHKLFLLHYDIFYPIYIINNYYTTIYLCYNTPSREIKVIDVLFDVHILVYFKKIINSKWCNLYDLKIFVLNLYPSKHPCHPPPAYCKLQCPWGIKLGYILYL